VVAVLLAAASAACAGLDVSTDPPEAKPGEVLGFEVGVVDPFDSQVASYGAMLLPIKVLPIDPPERITHENWYRTIPQYLLAHATLEVIAPFTMDDIDLGVSIHALTIRGDIPLRVGLNHTDAGWGWHVSGGIWSF
jgi:hypothetical protein